MTLNDGPLASSIFPVHVTSINRDAPFPSQGEVSVPGPAEPLGQSERGAALAVAATVGAALMAGAADETAGAADVAALCAVVAPDGLCSDDEQPNRAVATAAVM